MQESGCQHNPQPQKDAHIPPAASPACVSAQTSPYKSRQCQHGDCTHAAAAGAHAASLPPVPRRGKGMPQPSLCPQWICNIHYWIATGEPSWSVSALYTIICSQKINQSIKHPSRKTTDFVAEKMTVRGSDPATAIRRGTNYTRDARQ